MSLEASKPSVFQSVEGQSPVTSLLPKSTVGTHPETGAPVSVIQGGARPTVQDHLPTGEAARALQEALAATPRQLEQRNVTQTGPHSALSITPVGNNGPYPSSPSPPPSPSGGVANASPREERKSREGDEPPKDGSSVGSLEETRRAQDVENTLAELQIFNSDSFQSCRLSSMIARNSEQFMQVISLNRDAIEDVFDAFADEFSSDVITVSLVNLLFDSSQLSAHEKNEMRAGLTRQIGNYDIIPEEVEDWSRVQQIFTDRSEIWASKRYEFIQGNLKDLDQAGLSPQEMVFVPDQRYRNLCLLNLQSKLEANKILSNKEIARDADLAIDAVHFRYQAMFEKAMAAVVSRDGKERVNVKESVTVLKYLMHRGCDPSCADREMPTFFENEVTRLLQLDPETRAAKMNEFISTDLHIKYTPRKLIDSMSSIPCGETLKKIFRESGRCFAAVKFGRITLPFYLSSGQFPKDGVIPGKWYPFFGVGEDGWLNKESDKMPDYYASPKLAKIAKFLDEDFGDLRDEAAVYEVEEFPDEASEFINSDMREMAHLSDEADQRVNDNGEMSKYLSQSISGITALIDASNADERTAAAAHLAELDFKFGKNKGNVDHDSFVSARRAHYLTVEDPIAISSDQTAAQHEQKE